MLDRAQGEVTCGSLVFLILIYIFISCNVIIIEGCPTISNCCELAIRFVVKSAPTHCSKSINESVQ